MPQPYRGAFRRVYPVQLAAFMSMNIDRRLNAHRDLVPGACAAARPTDLACERVEPRAIKGTMLLTVGGENDDICAGGQTVTAHDLCTGLRPYLKRHHLQPGVGYGVFSGRRWEAQIYPLVKNVIQASD